MELLVKPEMLTSYIYGPAFGNAETVSFYLLHNVSTLNQCREVYCVTFVCKHFASWQSVYTQMWHRKPLCIDSVLKHFAANRKRLFQRCQTQVRIYTTLAFLALLGAPYKYDISSLRVKIYMYQYFKRQLKTPTCFGSCGIHPQGVLKRASLKLLVELSSEIVSPDTHTTGPNLKLPNTDYAHKTSQVISVKHF